MPSKAALMMPPTPMTTALTNGGDWAVANGIGQSELRRAQLTTFLSCVVRRLSGRSWVSIVRYFRHSDDS